MHRMHLKHDATNYVYFFCVSLLVYKGLKGAWPELDGYVRCLPHDGDSELWNVLRQNQYDKLLNDIGDVFEAVCAIANVNTPQSAQARYKIGLDPKEASLIMSHMGVLAESCGLLLTRFNLEEPEVVRLLGMQHPLPQPKQRDQRVQQGDRELRQVEQVSHNKIMSWTQDFHLSRVTFHDPLIPPERLET